MRLPDAVRDAALKYAYAVFDRLRWEQVPASERGAVYDEMIADEKFVALLRQFVSSSQMRVWLKDSAAKEYPRALEGVGYAANFTKRRYPGPEVIVSAVLGADWGVVDDSIKQKPMRCRVSNHADSEALVVWGPLRSLRDLYWSASRALAEGDDRVLLVVTRPTMSEISHDSWTQVCNLCALIGAEAYSAMYVPRIVE